MSHAEVERLELIGLVSASRLLQRSTAVRLGLSVRQVKRLVSRYRKLGAAGLVSGHGGKVPNNAFAAAFRHSIVELVKEQHADFGPTLARGKLWERQGCRVSAETLRQWMIEASPCGAHPAAPGASCPVSICSDRHSIFRVRAGHNSRERELTRCMRDLGTLDIEGIHAHTPQAKGRVVCNVYSLISMAIAAGTGYGYYNLIFMSKPSINFYVFVGVFLTEDLGI